MLPGQPDDPLHVEVRLHRSLALADEVGFVGLVPVEREAVLFGVHGHGLFAQFRARAEDADGDLAPVGDKHAPKSRHGHHPFNILKCCYSP